MNTLTITFKKENTGVKYSYKFELDNSKNKGLSDFNEDTTCFLKLYNLGTNLTIDTTSGTASIYGRNITEEQEEYVIFENSKEEALSYPIYRVEDYKWIGGDGGNVVFDEYNAKLPDKINGVLYVKYLTAYTSIKIDTRIIGKVLVVAEDEKGKGSIVIDYSGGYKDAYLTVKDACTKNVVAGARVYLDGKYVGNTDSFGKIYLGKIAIGKHKIKVSKTGYKDTDQDAIANDEFEITTE